MNFLLPTTLVLTVFSQLIFGSFAFASATKTSSPGIEYFDSDKIVCGPITTFIFADKSTLKIRSLYHEVKTIYDWYTPRKELYTAAYEVTSGEIKNTGVLDFYGENDETAIQFHLKNNYLVIDHKYGTHLVSLENLFSAKPYGYEASPYYSGHIVCRDNMP